MLTALRVRRFKNLKEADLSFGPFTLLIGPNASGKSNLLEAIRTAQGLALGYDVRDVLDGRRDEATRQRWPGIRGGAKYALRRPNDPGAPETIEIAVTAKDGEGQNECRWECEIHPAKARIVRESLKWLGRDERIVYDTHPEREPPTQDPDGPIISARVYTGRGGRQPHHDFSPARSVLTQLKGARVETEENEQLAETAARLIGDIHFLDPTPANLREYEKRGNLRMGDHGENFASVVHAIAEDPARRRDYLGWLEELTPARISDLHFFKTELDEVMFGVKENGSTDPVPAIALSDGTLRFAAIAAGVFQPQRPGSLILEEVENGVHSNRLRLLVELLKQGSRKGSPQIIATTHSALLLAFLAEQDYGHVLWAARSRETGAAQVLPLTRIPEFREVIRKTPISDLFAEGWLEAAV